MDEKTLEEQIIETVADYPIIGFFRYDHLPTRLRRLSRPFCELALDMADTPRNAETSAGLRKLLEAKDCFVRAALP